MNSKSIGLTTEEALHELERLSADAGSVQFSCDGHWNMGWSLGRGYWWDYYCCDICEQYDWEDHLTPADILNRFKDFIGTWDMTACE